MALLIKVLPYALAVGTAVAAAIVVWMIHGTLDTDQRLKLLQTGAGALIQLGTVGVVGILIKAAFDEVSASRRRRDATTELMRESLRQLRDVHQTMRVAPFHIDAAHTIKSYGEQMERILAARTQLTDLGNEIKVSNSFPRHRSELGGHLFYMTAYLTRLVREYAAMHHELCELEVTAPDAAWKKLTDLKNYGEFRSAVLEGWPSDDDSRAYFREYYQEYKKSKRLIRAAIEGTA